MHECPNGGQACDCIGDDTWDDSEAAECECECEDYDDEFDSIGLSDQEGDGDDT